MLELKNITKDYPASGNTVHALRGVSLQFRTSEFVSILGPSGCGKTTLLNIIGGLDRYSSGDLIINGRSTKDFNDRDWDSYRNHSVGFVFQNYNLIPHQTVLQNVELSLSLSGVSKRERRKRAKAALEDVGLGDQLYKRPSEMSGGQMQRVAIARALVNNPDIILADEPTGALDTETSAQVMNIMKEVSKDRLVVMVTHNPDIAETYSTRIIKMLDGKLLSDSSPLTEAELEAERVNDKSVSCEGAKKKPSMSLATSFSLSLKNLFTKKGRTMLTAFAGSIGIIGIALITAVSQGMTTYINTVQEEALSSYPITIEDTTVDLSSLMMAFMDSGNSAEEHDADAVYKKSALYDMMNALNSADVQKNDLQAFKRHIELRIAASDDDNTLYDAISGIQYTYDLPLLVYTESADGTIIPSDTTALMSELISEYMGADISAMMGVGAGSSGIMGTMVTSSNQMSENVMGLWQEMLPGKDGSLISDVVQSQYDVVYGSWPNSYDEIILVLDENNELDDMTLYAMGLIPREEIDEIMSAAMDGDMIESSGARWSYEEICCREYRVILNSDCYVYDKATGLYSDLRETEAGVRYLYDNGLKLRVTGIIKPNEDAAANMLHGSIAYTEALTEYVIKQSQTSEAIKLQMQDTTTDIITGLPFASNTDNMTVSLKAAEFRLHASELSTEKKAAVYKQIKSIPSNEMLEQSVSDLMAGLTRADMEKSMVEALLTQMSVSEDEIASYVGAMSDDEMTELYSKFAAEQVKLQYAQQVMQELAGIPDEHLAAALDSELSAFSNEMCAVYYDEIMVFSDSTYEANLLALGYVDLEIPSSVNLFASSFANKEVIEASIAEYNEDRDELSKIKYTDYIGIMLSSITTIIDAITYVLIAFVSISLIVSSIMIGVITLISVQERTKEIGILRSIGASKKNVSSMFNAETVMIGFASGVLGVVITWLLCIPINALLQYLTGLGNLKAYLPLPAALILVGISVALTLISGIIPSRSAAKKDPVVALRSE